MFKRSLLACSLLFLVSCFNANSPKNQTDEERLAAFRLTNQVGDTLCYRRYFLNTIPQRDTLRGLAIWVITKDTLVDGVPHLIYEGIEYGESLGDIDTTHRRSLVKHDNSEVECWDFNNGSFGFEFTNDPLRKKQDISKMTYREIASFLHRRTEGSRRVVDSNDIFHEHVYPLVYPLSNGGEWHFRKAGSKWGHSEYFKMCHGFDTLVDSGVPTEFVKTEMLIDKSLDLDLGLKNYGWYDSHGLYRSVWGYGDIEWEDGTKTNSNEEFQRISLAEFNPSTLTPYN